MHEPGHVTHRPPATFRHDWADTAQSLSVHSAVLYITLIPFGYLFIIVGHIRTLFIVASLRDGVVRRPTMAAVPAGAGHGCWDSELTRSGSGFF